MSLRRISRGIAYRFGLVSERLREAIAPVPGVPLGEGGRTVLLHVGAHKTGSTTIQFLLRQMTDELARRGIAYDREAYALGAELSRGSPLSAADRLGHAVAIGARLDAGRAPVAILSSESFFGDAFSGYANLSAVVDDLAHLLSGRHVTVIALVRRQDTYLASLYGQHVKEGGTQSMAEFRAAFPAGALDWDRRLQVFDASFGAVNVRAMAYETAFSEPERVLDRTFGTPERRLDFPAPPAPRRNPSLSAEGLRLMSEGNARLGDEARRALRQRLQTTHPRAPGEPDALLADGVGATIVASYREANERLFDSRLHDDPARAYYLPT